jgi:hypothetical protein
MSVESKRREAVRRLLIITYHFPPDGTIGGQRWAGLSKYLDRLGWEVHVITAAVSGATEVTPYIRRHARQRRLIFNDVYKAAVGRLRKPAVASRGSTGQTAPAQSRAPRPGAVRDLRRIAGSSMYLPDHARGWVGRAAAAARRLIRDQQFDVVISSGPPHSAHFAAWLATRGLRTPFWIDMRDPWSLTHEMNSPVDRVVLAERWFLRRLERLIFPRAARVVVNTQEFAAHLETNDPDLRVSCLPNGIDMEQLPSRNVSSVERGSIACIGTLYAGRNLSTLLAAISLVLKDQPRAASILRLNVAGLMQPRHREKLEAEIAAAGLTSIVTIHGMLPRGAALDLLSKSHLALVLAQDQPMCIPAKLYESVGLGVPTLVVAETASAAASEARRIGAMAVETDDVQGMRSLLNDMIAGRLPTAISPKTPIDYADLAVRLDRLLTVTAESRRVV